jgi:hypothetical protein
MRTHPTDPIRAAWLDRLLWQWLAVALLLYLAFPGLRAGDAWPGAGPLWLLGSPLASLLARHRRALAALAHWLAAAVGGRRRTMTFVLQGPNEARASVRLPPRRARDATDHLPVPGRRAARQQRRSPRNDHRPEPVAGRR